MRNFIIAALAVFALSGAARADDLQQLQDNVTRLAIQETGKLLAETNPSLQPAMRICAQINKNGQIDGWNDEISLMRRTMADMPWNPVDTSTVRGAAMIDARQYIMRMLDKMQKDVGRCNGYGGMIR